VNGEALRFVLALGLAIATTVRADSGGAPEGVISKIDPPEKDLFTKVIYYRGIPIKSSAEVADEALFAARDRLAMMLTNLPTVCENLRAGHAELHIIGRNQVTSDLPEWRFDKGKPLPEYNGLTIDQRTRGMGGRISSCGEENLLKLEKDRYEGLVWLDMVSLFPAETFKRNPPTSRLRRAPLKRIEIILAANSRPIHSL
jgi:hypothetical protein